MNRSCDTCTNAPKGDPRPGGEVVCQRTQEQVVDFTYIPLPFHVMGLDLVSVPGPLLRLFNFVHKAL